MTLALSSLFEMHNCSSIDSHNSKKLNQQQQLSLLNSLKGISLFILFVITKMVRDLRAEARVTHN